MSPTDRALFQAAFRKTVIKHVVVLILVGALGVGAAVTPFVDHHMSKAAVGLTLAFALLFLGITGWLAVRFVRVPRRFARLLDALETEPARISAVKLVGHHSELVGADGPGAQWTIEIQLDQMKLQLMPGKRTKAEALVAIIKARVPNVVESPTEERTIRAR